MKVKIFSNLHWDSLVKEVNDFCDQENINVCNVELTPRFNDEHHVMHFAAIVKYELIEKTPENIKEVESEEKPNEDTLIAFWKEPFESHKPEVLTDYIRYVCRDKATVSELYWNKKVPNGISKSTHYATFAEFLKNLIKEETSSTNKVICMSSNLITILHWLPNLHTSEQEFTPYTNLYGTINIDDSDIRIYIVPSLPNDTVLVMGEHGAVKSNVVNM